MLPSKLRVDPAVRKAVMEAERVEGVGSFRCIKPIPSASGAAVSPVPREKPPVQTLCVSQAQWFSGCVNLR